VDDCGTVAIMDPRLASKGYGRGIVKALPPAPVTTVLGDVRGFYRPLDGELPAAA
jgi:ATP-dependent DNA helicase DinG